MGGGLRQETRSSRRCNRLQPSRATTKQPHSRPTRPSRRQPSPKRVPQVVVFGGYGPLEGAGGGDGGSLDDVRVLHLVRPECHVPPDGDAKAGRASMKLLPG